MQGLEERILESQAWVSTSSVWEAVNNSSAGVPTCEDVSLPAQEFGGWGGGVQQSPVLHHRSYQIRSPITVER